MRQYVIETSSGTVMVSGETSEYEGTDLHPFTGNTITLNGVVVGSVEIDCERPAVFIENFELDASVRGKGLGTALIGKLLENFGALELSAVTESIPFWMKLGAKDLGRIALMGDRRMSVSLEDFVAVTSGKKKPYGINTYYRKPYEQSKDNFDSDSHLYKCVWEDNRLPVGTKLYLPNDVSEFDEYFSVGDKKLAFFLKDNGNAYVTCDPEMNVTRYSNVKYEGVLGIEDGLSKEETARKYFDAMVNGDAIIVYDPWKIMDSRLAM